MGKLRIFTASVQSSIIYISFRVLGLMTPHPFLEELFGYVTDVPPLIILQHEE